MTSLNPRGVQVCLQKCKPPPPPPLHLTHVVLFHFGCLRGKTERGETDQVHERGQIMKTSQFTKELYVCISQTKQDLMVIGGGFGSCYLTCYSTKSGLYEVK